MNTQDAIPAVNQLYATGTVAGKEFKFPKWINIVGDVHTMRDWELQYDLLAIEEFLNNMLICGWRPIQVSGGSKFSFVPCMPGEFICRTVLSVTKNGSFDRKKAAELSSLLSADHAQTVEQVKTWGTQIGLIALRPAALGNFEITSDLDSRIAEYEARKKGGTLIGGLYFTVAILQATIGIIGLVSTLMGDRTTSIAFLGTSAVWWMLAFYYYAPVTRYNKILKRLYAERDISE